jgi:hypothetical protein
MEQFSRDKDKQFSRRSLIPLLADARVLSVLGRCSRTKSFNPSTSFAVLCTVPSLLGAFSLGPSLVAADDAGLGALCPESSAPPRPLLLCFSPFDAPYCCGLNPLLPEPPAALDREPFETFWWLCGVLEAGGDGMVGIAFGSLEIICGSTWTWRGTLAVGSCAVYRGRPA